MDEAPRVCSECGYPPGEVPTAGPVVRRRRAIQAGVLALAVLVYAWVTARSWPAYGPPTTFGPGTTAHEYPTERFTLADVEAYARGERSDGRLLRALILDDPTGEFVLETGFAAPGGTATEFLRYGWPTPFMTFRWDGTYTDVYTKREVIAQPPSQLARWSGLAYITQRADGAGRRESRILSFDALVAPAVMLVLAWLGGWYAGRLVGARPWIRKVVAWGLMVAVGALILALSVRPVVDADLVWPSSATAAPTGLTIGDLRRLQREPGGEARAATAVFGSAPTAGAEGVLIVGIGPQVGMNQWVRWVGWPEGLILDSRVGAGSSREGDMVLERVRVENGWVSLVFTGAGSPGGSRWVNVSMTRAFQVVGCLLLAWLGAGWGMLALRWMQRRRAERRIGAGLCGRCGYDVRAGAVRDRD